MEQLNSFWIWSAIVIISSSAGVFILSGTLIIYWCSVLALTVFQRVILALWWWWDTEWIEDRAVAAGARWWPGRLPGQLPVEVWNQLLSSWGSTEEEECRQRWNKWMRVQLWEGVGRQHGSGGCLLVAEAVGGLHGLQTDVQPDAMEVCQPLTICLLARPADAPSNFHHPVASFLFDGSWLSCLLEHGIFY